MSTRSAGPAFERILRDLEDLEGIDLQLYLSVMAIDIDRVPDMLAHDEPAHAHRCPPLDPHAVADRGALPGPAASHEWQ
jgi:hypothetical protein